MKMRMLMAVRIPHEDFSERVRDGSIGEKLQKIIEAAKPEVCYFTELDGQRAVLMAINIENQSEVPAFAEPWFLTFNADVEFRVAMTPADLEKAGLDDLARAWG
jgi:hypothetical protein